MKESLDLKVNEVVKVMRDGKCVAISIVDKVLPNKRFKLRNTSFYWRANGTRNTHTVKSHKNDYVLTGDAKDYEQAYRNGLQERLIMAGEQVYCAECVQSVEALVFLNKILDNFGFQEHTYLNSIEKNLKEKQKNI